MLFYVRHCHPHQQLHPYSSSNHEASHVSVPYALLLLTLVLLVLLFLACQPSSYPGVKVMVTVIIADNSNSQVNELELSSKLVL
jgi:hypothetical protein